MGGKYYLSPYLSCGLVNLEETIWVTAELYSDNPKQWQFAYFFFVWYCLLLSRRLVNRAEIYTHKVATLLLITHINLFFFFTGRLASCYMLKLKQHCLQDCIAIWIKTPSIFGQRILWRSQHSSTPRSPTLKSYYIVVLSPRNMHQYASSFL